MRSFSRQGGRLYCRHRGRTLSTGPVWESSASYWTTSLQQPIMWLRCCHPDPACCTRYECCARTARWPRRCKTYSAQQSSRISCTRHHRGLACVQLPTTYVLIRCYVAANATAEATCRSSQNCSVLLTTTFSSASKLTLTMSFSHIFLNIQSLHTSSAPALITSL